MTIEGSLPGAPCRASEVDQKTGVQTTIQKMKPKSITTRIDLINIGREPGTFAFESRDVQIDRKSANLIDREAAKAKKLLDGKGEFAVLGSRLAAIRDCRLFRFFGGPDGKPFTTFSQYCTAREKMSPSKGSKLINSARRVFALQSMGVVAPRTLGQVEELLPLSVADSISVLKEAAGVAGTDQPSSLLIRETVRKLGLRRQWRPSLGPIESSLLERIKSLVIELNRVATAAKHTELHSILDRLKSLVFTIKVSESETVPQPRRLEAPSDRPESVLEEPTGSRAAIPATQLNSCGEPELSEKPNGQTASPHEVSVVAAKPGPMFTDRVVTNPQQDGPDPTLGTEVSDDRVPRLEVHGAEVTFAFSSKSQYSAYRASGLNPRRDGFRYDSARGLWTYRGKNPEHAELIAGQFRAQLCRSNPA